MKHQATDNRGLGIMGHYTSIRLIIVTLATSRFIMMNSTRPTMVLKIIKVPSSSDDENHWARSMEMVTTKRISCEGVHYKNVFGSLPQPILSTMQTWPTVW